MPHNTPSCFSRVRLVALVHIAGRGACTGAHLLGLVEQVLRVQQVGAQVAVARYHRMQRSLVLALDRLGWHPSQRVLFVFVSLVSTHMKVCTHTQYTHEMSTQLIAESTLDTPPPPDSICC